MRIKGWHVNGFGVFHNYSIDNLSAGLTVFVGPNEAGKSTLLAFIRTILFGFPDGRSKELKYPPLNGGRHGGRLILTARGHDYVIERHAGEKLPFVLTLSNGQCGDESDLRSLTGGADDRLFRSVFAFSLSELQVLETLTAEGVRDRIFSAGISGAGPSARAAMKELEDHSATLLRPRRQARISQLLTEINKIDEQLEKAKSSAKSYLDWVRNEEDCKIEIGRFWEKIKESKKRETHLNTLLELWPDWTHLRNIKAKLNATESVAEFPADGEERQIHLTQKCRAAEQSIEELKNTTKTAKHRLEVLESQRLPQSRKRVTLLCLIALLTLSLASVVLSMSSNNFIPYGSLGVVASMCLTYLLWQRQHVNAQIENERNDNMAVFDEELKNAALKIKRLENVLHRWLEEQQKLYRKAGATDDNSFQDLLSNYKKRTRLRINFNDLEKQIFSRIDRGPSADTLRQLLSAGHIEKWRSEAEITKSETEKLQNLRDKAIAQHRDAQRTKLELEASADIIRLETIREGLLSELNIATHRLRAIGLARTLIEKTLREFERTRQPRVLAQASKMFSFVTNGRYERLFQRESDNKTVIINKDKESLALEALSRGTAEQLYLCIRLALASEFGRRSEPLPIVMDDVFVNFDPSRARAIGQIVTEFSRTQQVLIFTCHPSTSDMLINLAPETRIVTLGTNTPNS
jgi:uncharacterized protein YhaN